MGGEQKIESWEMECLLEEAEVEGRNERYGMQFEFGT